METGRESAVAAPPAPGAAAISLRVADVEVSRLQPIVRLSFFLVALPLVLSAMDRLSAAGGSAAFVRTFVGLMLLSALLNIVTGARYARLTPRRRDQLERVLFALTGAVYILDGVDKMLAAPRTLPVVLMGVGAAYLVLALLKVRALVRQTLRVGAGGVTVRMNLLRRVRVPVGDIASLGFDGHRLRVERRDGHWIEATVHRAALDRAGELEAAVAALAARAADRPPGASLRCGGKN
ncbi:MAG: PH domain-containing protein [Candidatus Krumholzibacteriota bacterium]|nr:PH domain-containing protein [Candidatus Krumholzibacteriota bacterium]